MGTGVERESVLTTGQARAAAEIETGIGSVLTGMQSRIVPVRGGVGLMNESGAGNAKSRVPATVSGVSASGNGASSPVLATVRGISASGNGASKPVLVTVRGISASGIGAVLVTSNLVLAIVRGVSTNGNGAALAMTPALATVSAVDQAALARQTRTMTIVSAGGLALHIALRMNPSSRIFPGLPEAAPVREAARVGQIPRGLRLVMVLILLPVVSSHVVVRSRSPVAT
jgi:hypothetical protein